MSEDLYSRLRTVLETQTSDSSDGSDTEALMQRITRQIKKDRNHAIHPEDASAMTESLSGEQGHSKSTTRLRHHHHHQPLKGRRRVPTPYEVWLSKRGPSGEHRRRRRQRRRVMHEKDWERLVLSMGRLDADKRNAVLHQQYKEMAEELKSLPFRPELNKQSLQLARGVKALRDRQPELIKVREEHLKQQRVQKLAEEMKECTFKPKMSAVTSSGRYLRRAVRAGRKMDFNEFLAARRRKRQLRRKAQEEAEGRELTFRPRLSKMSMKIMRRAKREGRVVVDDVTGQTVKLVEEDEAAVAAGGVLLSGRKAASVAARREEETFEPLLTSRSARYRPPAGSKPVHTRLYDSAMAKAFRARRNGDTMHHPHHQQHCGTQSPAHTADRIISKTRMTSSTRTQALLLQGSDVPVLTVVTYQERYDHLVRPMNPSFLRSMTPAGVCHVAW